VDTNVLGRNILLSVLEGTGDGMLQTIVDNYTKHTHKTKRRAKRRKRGSEKGGNRNQA
jgi:hypothetical protein